LQILWQQLEEEDRVSRKVKISLDKRLKVSYVEVPHMLLRAEVSDIFPNRRKITPRKDIRFGYYVEMLTLPPKDYFLAKAKPEISFQLAIERWVNNFVAKVYRDFKPYIASKIDKRTLKRKKAETETSLLEGFLSSFKDTDVPDDIPLLAIAMFWKEAGEVYSFIFVPNIKFVDWLKRILECDKARRVGEERRKGKNFSVHPCRL